MKEPLKPAATPWQRKWLKLDCYDKDGRLQELANTAQDFCGRWFRNDRSGPTLLVIAGDQNCGKTHVASRIFDFARAAGFSSWERGHRACPPSVTYYYWPETVDVFYDGEHGGMETMLKSDLLIIDDIGAEHDPRKIAANKLCQLLSRREREWSVTTTNIAPEYWPERLDARISDRLLRNSEVVQLFGLESYALHQ